MADNKVMYDSSQNTFTLAMDDISSVFFPRHKVAWGADGVANDVSAATPLPVTAGGYTPTVDLTPTLDTSLYTTGDTLFVATAVPLARISDGTGVVTTVAAIDKSDLKIPFDLYFFSSAVTFGTINVAPSISDADGAAYLGHVSFAAADYKDLGGVNVAIKTAVGINFKPASGTQNVYVAGVIQSGLTVAASDLVLRFGVSQD
jgi:hypothetical protein